MKDPKARLHCCGLHHSHGPAGVNLIMTLRSAPLECYGTGDNPDSAIILILPATYSKTERLHIADVIARGAGVTVLVPPIFEPQPAASSSSSSTKRPREDDARPVSGGDLRAELVEYLKTVMQVKYIGFLQESETQALDIIPDTTCCVTITRDEDLSHLPKVTVPTLWISLTTGPTEETVIIDEDSIGIRSRKIHADSQNDKILAREEEEGGYRECMRDLLYWFKKHLHDWS